MLIALPFNVFRFFPAQRPQPLDLGPCVITPHFSASVLRPRRREFGIPRFQFKPHAI
jgi:hypothetical protein